VAAFLDTNVLVYAFDQSEPDKRSIAIEIIAGKMGPYTVSAQVLNEFYWTATRKLQPPLSNEAAKQVVEKLSLGYVVPIDALLVRQAIRLVEEARIPLWDAGIVVAARRAGANKLLTEDLNHGQVIAGVTILDPFR
jgi:predicted nucleic acid-binding protein